MIAYSQDDALAEYDGGRDPHSHVLDVVSIPRSRELEL